MSDEANNTGNNNTGDRNTGDRNTGDRNAGNWNTGNCNTGDCNTGHRNAGDRNAGNCNTGYYNAGYRNTGDRNAGYWNTGNYNTGHYNTGNWNTGYFCENDGPVMLFDTPTSLSREEVQDLIPWIELPCGAEWVGEANMTDDQKEENPSYKTTGGFHRALNLTIREAFPIAWAKLSDEERAEWKPLFDRPEFDADKFERITGVRIGGDNEPKKEIVIDGVTYVRKP